MKIYQYGDKIKATIYGTEWRGTVIRVGASGIVFARNDKTGIERFFFPESIEESSHENL